MFNSFVLVMTIWGADLEFVMRMFVPVWLLGSLSKQNSTSSLDRKYFAYEKREKE